MPHQQLASRLAAHFPVDQAAIERLLAASPAVAVGATSQLETPDCVVINDRERLYLQRYWRYEVLLAQRLKKMDQASPLAEVIALRSMLAEFFATSSEPNWQMIAAATALMRRLTIITGGPGTAKHIRQPDCWP